MSSKKNIFISLFWAAIAIVIVASCTSAPPRDKPSPSLAVKAEAAPPLAAIAHLTPTAGNQVTGSVRFVQSGDTVTVTAKIQGLQPESVHAWHIHEFGDLSSSDGKAMGGHYNPEQMPHGLPNNSKRHAGDLGNLTADRQGRATKELTVDNITINGAKNPILGRGMIIHAETDDGGQPLGNAGKRIAQGIIGVPQSG